jgi:hypothetical protein
MAIFLFVLAHSWNDSPSHILRIQDGSGPTRQYDSVRQRLAHREESDAG